MRSILFLNVVWANCGLNEEVDGAFGERVVFVFSRNIKDGFLLPLLIDLCKKSVLVLPPCFTRLPTDLKLKINGRRVVDPLQFLGGPHPFPGPWMPNVIDGDYDLFPPQFDNTGNPLGQAPPSRLLHAWSNHVPRCQLGGHRSNFT
ncbi:hypothetical protein P3S68_001258 [Capsicum galapagoense]